MCDAIHVAASWGMHETCQLILRRVPGALAAVDADGRLPIERALESRRLPVADLFVSRRMPETALLLRTLASVAREAPELVAKIVRVNVPFPTSECWDLIPKGCPRLSEAFGAVLNESPSDLPRLFERLSVAEADAVRSVALLAIRARLSTDVALRILGRVFSPKKSLVTGPW